MPRLPDCPNCGSARHVYEEGERNYFCTLCHRAFDDEPDEGGDYSSSDPSWRMQREERRRERERNLGRRRG